jgi:hypothetical protein
MSRTIGDFEAGDAVTALPELRQVTLPSSGARLILASDGLWDALNPKTALHSVRGMNTGQAAHHLVRSFPVELDVGKLCFNIFDSVISVYSVSRSTTTTYTSRTFKVKILAAKSRL